jgi:hypothetical protein
LNNRYPVTELRYFSGAREMLSATNAAAAFQKQALSLEAMSDEIGTEVSGVLGVINLRNLDVTIDYRDGLLAFDFNTNP